MKKNNVEKDHPEVANIKNICDVSPNTKITRDVCKKIIKNPADNKTNPGSKKSIIEK